MVGTIERPVPAGTHRLRADPGRRGPQSPSTRRRPVPPQRVAPGPTRVAAFRLTHIPALDGLRGLAVAGVVAFHTGWLHGGFLGVDLFFVLSGFLITSLLLAERLDTGTVDLRTFWIRRARRLLPALVALLVAVALYAWLLAEPTELGRIRNDGFAALFYVANWRSILAQQGYWDLFATPSPLQHVWSLAIEEQFYLVWPLLLGALLWWRRGSRRAVAAFSMAFALAATFWMAVQYDPDNTNRAYLGTDTRIPALLLGAALAAWLQWKGPVRSFRGRIRLEAAATGAVVFAAGMWALADGSWWALYHGGLFACGVAVVLVIASITHPVAGPLSRVLSIRPLCWLGLISYGLYLWHWPVIVVLDHDRTGLDGVALTALQVSVSLVLAVVSYHLIEQPIRRRGLAALRWRPLAPVAAVVAMAFLLLATSGAQDPVAISAGTADTTPIAQRAGMPVALAHPERVRADRPLPRPDGRPPRLLLVGDSVAFELGTNLARDPGRFGLDLAARGVPACKLEQQTGRVAVPRNGPKYTSAGLPECQLPPTTWEQDVAAFNPDAVLMVFAIPGTPTWVDPKLTDPCDSRYTAFYRAELDRAIGTVTDKGAIAYVTTLPYPRVKAWGRTLDYPVACANPVIRDAVAANPKARLIDLGTWTCPTADSCREKASDGSKLRYDGMHYRDQGADDANRWMLDQVFEPAAAPATTSPTATRPSGG